MATAPAAALFDCHWIWMCGIAGSLGMLPGTQSSIDEAVQRMVSTLVHRGPDDGGVWSDPTCGIGLGNRRLAIVDLSPAGHQPMHSPSRRYVLTLNGEIYNHEVLRARLESEGRAPDWRGSSDTEVLNAGFEAWGIRATIEACIGMFGVAVWDRDERRLTLARDRIGEKPVYFGRFGRVWLFGSELKALAAHPRFVRAIDPGALSSYMSLGYVPAPGSIFRHVGKVRPGCLVTLEAGRDEPREEAYWSATALSALPKRTFTHDTEAVDALESLLSDAVRRQMTSDRPLGALLSGGIDSSSIVAMMRTQRTTPIKTFSIGFQQSSFNEALYAARVAAHFSTDHTELYVGEHDVRETIPLLPQIYDEPFADVSQIPTFLVSRLAGSAVTVALTGDGGDELFGGYPRYRMAARLWSTMQRVPRHWRPTIGRLLEGTPDAVDRAFAWAFPHDEDSGIRGLRPAQKLGKLGRAFSRPDIETLYWALLAPWSEPDLVNRAAAGSPFPRDAVRFDAGSIEENFMLRDLVGYLPDCILTKIDRAAMAVSLESRAPLLDHRVVEFALRLPQRLKYRDGLGKWLLRQVLYRHVPKELVDRPKMGFGIPIASWLRGPLRPWAHDLLASSHGEMAQMLDLKAMARLLDRHASGVGDWHLPLWTGLMFLNWVQHFEHPSAGSTTPPATVIDATNVWGQDSAPLRA